uniref:Uncharacterized protein n=1 Tax=Aegilops tauschii subsp. strangulata TaxID=200361 RepID=A0A453C5T6_AEGTS
MTCPTIPDSKNCAKYGKQMDYVNWRWKPQGCDMARFQPQLFLNIVQGKTLAFAGDSIGRNQMESLLCLLSQVEAPTKVHSDTKDKFITWKTNYLYEDGKLIGCIYCSEDNITSFSVISAIQRVFRTAISNLNSRRESRLQLTVVRTATPAHFENGQWNTGGTCNRTEPVGEGTAMTSTSEREIRDVQVEEANRAQKEKKQKGGMNIEILDITKLMSMRPDAHPGIHWNNEWMRGYSDCSHWCLPGPIDMWNELLLAVLYKY